MKAISEIQKVRWHYALELVNKASSLLLETPYHLAFSYIGLKRLAENVLDPTEYSKPLRSVMLRTFTSFYQTTTCVSIEFAKHDSLDLIKILADQ